MAACGNERKDTSPSIQGNQQPQPQGNQQPQPQGNQQPQPQALPLLNGTWRLTSVNFRDGRVDNSLTQNGITVNYNFSSNTSGTATWTQTQNGGTTVLAIPFTISYGANNQVQVTVEPHSSATITFNNQPLENVRRNPRIPAVVFQILENTITLVERTMHLLVPFTGTANIQGDNLTVQGIFTYSADTTSYQFTR